MAELRCDDGAVIHWEERGEGPPLLISHNSNVSMPSNLGALLSDLAADHRVVTWDPRGTGQSSRTGPYEIATDADDMAALVEEVGHPVVAVSVGLSLAPLELVTMRSQLVEAVVLVGALPPLRPSDGDEGESLLDSGSVVAAVLELMRTDPRSLLRSMVSMGNTQLSEDEVRERVEAQLVYCPSAVTLERGEELLGYDARRTCAGLGGQLWIVHWENPMSPRGAATRVGTLMPEAHLVEVEDGPISRPELTAGVVREAAATLRGP